MGYSGYLDKTGGDSMGKDMIRILLVEDNKAHAELICRAFESQAEGTILTLAHTLREARDRLAEELPDLAFVDVVLPDGNGLDLLPAQGDPLGYPIVVMTARGNEGMAVTAMKKGALDYVVKSAISFRDMPRIAERVLREWAHLNERKRAEEFLRLQNTVLKRIVDGVSQREILNDLCQTVEQMTPDAICSILLLDKEGKLLRFGAGPRISADLAKALDGLVPGELGGSCGKAVHLKKAVFVTDTMIDPSWANFRDVAQLHGIGSCWSIPIFSEGKTVLGTFAISHPTPRGPEPFHLSLLDNSSYLAGVVIQRKRVEEKLHRYEQIIGGTSDFLAFIDEKFKYQEVNPSYVKAVGKTREEIVGNTGEKLFGKEFFETTLKPSQARCLSGENVSYETWVEFPGLGRRFLDVHYTPFQEDEEGISGIVAAVRDITGRKQAEDALRDSEERFRALIEVLPQQVWTARPDGSLDYVNQRILDYFGRTSEQMVGWGWKEILHPDDLPLCLERWSHARESLTSYEIEFRLRRGKDDSYRWHLGRVLPIFNQEGQVMKWIGTNTDVTELKQLEAQVQQAQKMEAIGTLAGGIAHDFNNILAAIMGYAEIAGLKVDGNDPVRQNLNEVLVAGHRAKELVQQILAFSRQGEQPHQPIELQVTVKEVLKFLRATLPANIEIQQHFLEESTIILGNPIQIHQVIMNLCTNAEYFMRERGGVLGISLDHVYVGLTPMVMHPDLKPGWYVCLTVRDTGVGISAEVVPRIFDPFFTTKRIGEGSGMGLAVVHGIVGSHGGKISVETKLEEGTTFTLYFPAMENGKVSDPSLGSDQEFLRGSGHVLLIEDEVPLAKLAQETLERLGYTVTMRTSSIEALAAFRSDPFRFDVVITDQTMPNMTGDALARELLEIRPDVPIVLCTGFSYLVTPEKAKAMGIRAFLMKPLLIRDLGRVLHEIVPPKTNV